MPSVIYELKENVAVLTLNRPEKFHAFNNEMAQELLQGLQKAINDENVRCIYLTGSGKAFSSGQDLGAINEINEAVIHKVITEQYNPIIITIRSATKPVVCGVNGIAAGAGANVALCADIVIAKESATFIQAFSKIGLIPDSGGTYFLPRLVGFQKALALALTAEKVTATDAEKMGMIYKVFSDETFDEEAIKLCNQLAAMLTRALYLTKRAFNQSFQNTLTQQLNLEDELQQQAAATSDFKEGVTAFKEKRAPVFKGK